MATTAPDWRLHGPHFFPGMLSTRCTGPFSREREREREFWVPRATLARVDRLLILAEAGDGGDAVGSIDYAGDGERFVPAAVCPVDVALKRVVFQLNEGHRWLAVRHVTTPVMVLCCEPRRETKFKSPQVFRTIDVDRLRFDPILNPSRSFSPKLLARVRSEIHDGKRPRVVGAFRRSIALIALSLGRKRSPWALRTAPRAVADTTSAIGQYRKTTPPPIDLPFVARWKASMTRTPPGLSARWKTSVMPRAPT
jgi:hypothetical protein